MDSATCKCGEEMKISEVECESCKAKDISDMWSFYLGFHGFEEDGENVWRKKDRNFKVIFEGFAYCVYSYFIDYHGNEQTVFLTNLQDPYLFNDFVEILDTNLCEVN